MVTMARAANSTKRTTKRRSKVAASAAAPGPFNNPPEWNDGDADIFLRGHRIAKLIEDGSVAAINEIRSMCRVVAFSNPYANCAQNATAQSVVGLGPKLSLSDKTLKAEQSALQKWFDKSGVVDLLSTAIKSLFYDGESFFRIVRNEAKEYGIDYTLIPSSHIGTLGNATNGIDYDAFGNPIAYSYRPTVTYGVEETIPADQVYHFFVPVFPEQRNGIPRLATAVRALESLQVYNEAVVKAATLQANMTVVAVDPPNNMRGKTNTEKPRVKNASIIRVPNGASVNALQSSQPNSNNKEFIATQLGQIGAGVFMPRTILSNDNSDSNFSASRMDHLMFFREVAYLQSKLAQVCDWIIRPLMDAMGIECETSWYFKGMEAIDTLKEINTWRAEMEMAVASGQEYCAQFGQDYDEVSEQRLDEIVGYEKRLQEKRRAAGLSVGNNETETTALPENGS